MTYAEKIGPEDRELDLSRPEEAVEQGPGALAAHRRARPSCTGGACSVWRARVEDGEFVPVEVQPEGGRRMGYDEWLRGLR